MSGMSSSSQAQFIPSDTAERLVSTEYMGTRRGAETIRVTSIPRAESAHSVSVSASANITIRRNAFLPLKVLYIMKSLPG